MKQRETERDRETRKRERREEISLMNIKPIFTFYHAIIMSTFGLNLSGWGNVNILCVVWVMCVRKIVWR
jgi:hypothetical protein